MHFNQRHKLFICFVVSRPYVSYAIPFGIHWGRLVIFSKILVDIFIRHENLRFSVTSFHHYFRNWRFCRSCCCCCFFFKLCIVANSVQRIRETIFQTSKGKEIAREKIEAKRVRVIHHLKPPQKNKGVIYSRLALKSRVFHLSLFVL